MKFAAIALWVAAFLACQGCSNADSSEGGTETSPAVAKKQIDQSLTKDQQSDLNAKVKAWDPKKDKK